MRAAVYLRQSLDRTGEELGITRQREDCEQLCARRGWTVTELISDNDTSASNGKARPGFTRLLALIDARAVDVVACWHADRLVRRIVDLEDVIERCQMRGVLLATVSGDLDLSTDAGRLVARILASVARAEVERKGARQRRAAEQSAANGLPAGGPRAFGFAPNKLTLAEPEAEAIRGAYAMLLAGGSLSAIARAWNAAGLVSGRIRSGRIGTGGPSSWSGKTVRAVLCNPRNAGLRARHGEVIGPARWPEIVPEETWRAAVAVLEDPARFSRRPRANVRHLLSGVALCGVCGAPVHSGTRRNGYHSYRCSSTLGHVARRGDHADGFVSAVIVERLSRPDAAELLADPARPDVPGLREEANALRSRLDTAAAEFADDTLTAGQLRTISRRLRERLAGVESEIAEAGHVSLLGPLVRSHDVQAAWDGLDVDRQRAVIEVLATVRLHPVGRGARRFDPATVEVEPKGGPPSPITRSRP